MPAPPPGSPIGRDHSAHRRRHAAHGLHRLRAAQEPNPLVEVRLLASRAVASSSAVLFFSGFSLYGAMLLMPLYYQDVRGATALAAGVMLVPQGVGAVLSRTVAGNNIDRFGSRVIALAGFAIVAAATASVRLGRAAHQRVAARRLDGRPRVRPRGRDHAGSGRRRTSAWTRSRSRTPACSPGPRSSSAVRSAPPSWRRFSRAPSPRVRPRWRTRSTWRSGGPLASLPSPWCSPCGSPAFSGRPRPGPS